MEAVHFKKGTTFLVTGGAGFIGSNLCKTLLDLGCRVRCLDDLSTGKHENVEPFLDNPDFSFVKGDISDFNTCSQACDGIEYVLHQAAWGSVPRSIEMPLFYEKINVQGTLNMMEAAKVNHVRKFVYASSSSVYGDHPALPKKEGTEGILLSPYALTKKTCEGYGKLYAMHYGLDTYGLRYFNVFGRHQDAHGPYSAVIPKFIKALMNGVQPVIYGDGTQSRDFTYIENVIQANIAACTATHEASGEAFNIAFGDCVTLFEVYDIIAQLLGKQDIKPIFEPERKGDIKHSQADISKARQMLGYSPQYSFHDGIRATIDWYLENLTD